MAPWQQNTRRRTGRARVQYHGRSRGRCPAAGRAPPGALIGGAPNSTGVVLYFAAEREPALWAAIALMGIAALGAVLLHRRIVPQKIVLNVIALGLLDIALGFAVATLKTALIAHPVLRFPASGVTVTGFVELREESQHTDRFVLRVDRIDGGRIEEAPRRVGLSVKPGMAPAPGSLDQGL